MANRRFREETVTDLMMGALVTAGHRGVVVEFPDEPVTGADMEWNFVDRRNSTFFRVMLQAKQAYGDGEVWTRHCYRELLHTSGSGSKLQAEALCDTSRHPGSATYPLYVLYHPARTCGLARGHCDVLAGVNLADGFVIERLVKAATTRALRTSNKSLGVIGPTLSPLSTIFCPATFASPPSATLAAATRPSSTDGATSGTGLVLGTPTPPTPVEVRDRIVALRARAASTGAVGRSGIPSTDVPEVADAIPDDVRPLVEQLDDPSEAPVSARRADRWRLTFVSDGPRRSAARASGEKPTPPSSRGRPGPRL